MRPQLSLILCALAWLPALAAAAPPQSTRYLAALVGDWEFRGTVRHQQVRYRAQGRWVLNGAWVELHLRDAAHPPQYEARVFLGYDAKADDYVAHWLDRFGAPGARVTASGHRDGRTLVLLFPYADGAFRDTLTLAPDGSAGTLLLESQDQDGAWSTFASYRMRKLAAGRAGG